MRRYNTSIKAIMQARSAFYQETGTRPIFLSDWDSDYNSIHMPNLSLNSVQLSDVQKYYFWTDEEGYRDTIVKQIIIMEKSLLLRLKQAVL